MQHKKEKGRDFLPGPWNVSVLYSAVALKAASRELGRYKFELVGLQEVRLDNGGTVRARDCNFFYGKGIQNHQLITRCFYTKRYHRRLRK